MRFKVSLRVLTLVVDVGSTRAEIVAQNEFSYLWRFRQKGNEAERTVFMAVSAHPFLMLRHPWHQVLFAGDLSGGDFHRGPDDGLR